MLFQYGVLERLRRTQAHDGLRLDLDRFAGLRIAPHARLAVRFHDAADARDYELARSALGFFHCELEKLFKELSGGFLRCGELLGDMPNDFRLAQWLGHL